MNQKKIKLLIVSGSAWDDNNSFGNSFSNIFGGNDNYEIYNIYCSEGKPDNKIVKRHFQISFKDIVKVLLHKKDSVGKEISESEVATVLSDNDSKLRNKASSMRWQIMFWARDAVWASRKWENESLNEFILSVNPDIIVQPVYYSSYINEVGIYAQKLTGAPMVGYISDDNYTLRQFSISPLFWIDRLWKRRYVKRAVDRCRLLYVITEQQRKEYNAIFGEKCKLLFKGGDFSKEKFTKPVGNPIKLIYTGNILSGRWKILAKIAAALKNINSQRYTNQAELYIYTSSPISESMKRQLEIPGTSKLMKAVPASEVKGLQQSADILIHVEPFELSERYKARLSFSTKIVDYLEAGRCILAIGWEETGGIEYLRQENAAFCITDENRIEEELAQLLSEPRKIEELGKRGFECGKRNHQHETIRCGLYRDLSAIAFSGSI